MSYKVKIVNLEIRQIFRVIAYLSNITIQTIIKIIEYGTFQPVISVVLIEA